MASDIFGQKGLMPRTDYGAGVPLYL